MLYQMFASVIDFYYHIVVQWNACQNLIVTDRIAKCEHNLLVYWYCLGCHGFNFFRRYYCLLLLHLFFKNSVLCSECELIFMHSVFVLGLTLIYWLLGVIFFQFLLCHYVTFLVWCQTVISSVFFNVITFTCYWLFDLVINSTLH